MTDRYDELSVPPDPSLAEVLRQRLHALMASASRDDHEGRSHLPVGAARLDPEQHPVPMKETYVSLDSTTSDSRNPRRMVMAAAAVVAVIGVAGVVFAVNTSSDDDEAPAAAETGAPTVVTPATGAPTTVAPSRETGFFAGGDDVPVSFIVPDGWVNRRWYVALENTDPIVGVAFHDVANIYRDPCQWILVDPPVGPTVDDLVSALTNVPGFDVAAPVDITVDGYNGKQIEYTVPDYNEDDCRAGKFGLYLESGSTGQLPNFWAQGPNQHNQLWILDVDGTRLVITAGSFPNTSQQERAVIDEIISSIQIG